jgi:hypothetical protein
MVPQKLVPRKCPLLRPSGRRQRCSLALQVTVQAGMRLQGSVISGRLAMPFVAIERESVGAARLVVAAAAGECWKSLTDLESADLLIDGPDRTVLEVS